MLHCSGPAPGTKQGRAPMTRARFPVCRWGGGCAQTIQRRKQRREGGEAPQTHASAHARALVFPPGALFLHAAEVGTVCSRLRLSLKIESEARVTRMRLSEAQ